MKRKLLISLWLLTFAISIISCTKGSNVSQSEDNKIKQEVINWEERWLVASECAETPDFPEVLWIKREGNLDWELLYPPFVDGFEYQEGYEYLIVVCAETQDLDTLPEDSPSIMYTLIEIISKEQKQSVGIPTLNF